ncbi:hypothetical protein Ndes2526A_g07695 [Nannochloris sp. 'desiccata']
MKNTTSLMALFGAILLLLACTAQSRQEPLGRRLSQAGAVASGSGDSVSTSTRTESSDRDAAVVEGTTEMPNTVVDGNSLATATGTATTWPNWPTTWRCNWPWVCKEPPKMPPPPHSPPPHSPPSPPHSPPPPHSQPPHSPPPPPPPHRPPRPHRPRPPTKIPIHRRKEVKIIIVPPKPVPEIPVCKGKIKEACCDSKDYCPWNWQWYPDKEPPKICKVEVEVIKEFKLCQWPVLVWKDEYDYTCKCPETPDPCPHCDVCFVQSSTSAFARADAFASSGVDLYIGLNSRLFNFLSPSITAETSPRLSANCTVQSQI